MNAATLLGAGGGRSVISSEQEQQQLADREKVEKVRAEKAAADVAAHLARETQARLVAEEQARAGKTMADEIAQLEADAKAAELKVPYLWHHLDLIRALLLYGVKCVKYVVT